jgi:putative transposase
MAEGLEPEQAAVMRRHERTGRPLGSEAFLKRLENKLGRILRKKPAGRKPKTKEKQVWCP